MLLFDIKNISDKNIHQKNKYFFASFNNDQGLRLDDKTKGLCRQKYQRSSKFVTWGHTTRVIFRVKTCIFEWSNEKNHFSKTKIYFHNKEKVCRTKNICQKNKYFFASFNNDRGLSLNDKTKDYAVRNTGGWVNSSHEVTQLW